MQRAQDLAHGSRRLRFTHQEDKLITAPKEVTKERFTDLFRVLPAAKWTFRPGQESFYMPEHVSGNIVIWAVRVTDRYYELLNRAGLSHDDVVHICLSAQDKAQG